MTSRPADGGPSRRRRGLWWTATVLLVVPVLAFVIWQQGRVGDGNAPLNAIAKAAEITQREPGGHAAMRATVSSPTQSKPLTIAGKVVFDNTGRSRGVLTMPNPDSGGRTEMQYVGDGASLFMSSPLFGSLPGGRKWMGLDFSSGEDPAAALPANGDAQQGLKLLEGVDDVKKVGREDVRSVPTTRYRGTLGTSGRRAPLGVEVWIDANERVRRMRLVSSKPQTGGKGSTTIDMRMDFFDFGDVPEINVPRSSEVFDATALAEGASPSEGK